MKYFLSFLVFVILSTVSIKAQTTAIKALDSAKFEYKSGRLGRAMLFLDRAEELNASRQIKGEIYLNKARVYSLEHNSLMAAFYTNKFLVLSPFTKFDTDEFSEIIITAANAKISPRLSVGASYGINIAKVRVKNQISLISSSHAALVSNSSDFVDYSFGINAEFYWQSRLAFVGELNSTKMNFVRSTYIENLASSYNYLYMELSYLQIPFGLQLDILPVLFYKKDKAFNLSIAGGFFTSFLANAKAFPDGYKDYTANINYVNANNYFNSKVFGAWAQANLAYRIRNGKIELKMRYNYDLTLINNDANRYSIGTGDNILFDYYQIFDDIHIDNYSLNLSYSYYLRYKIFSKLLRKKIEGQ